MRDKDRTSGKDRKIKRWTDGKTDKRNEVSRQKKKKKKVEKKCGNAYAQFWSDGDGIQSV